MLFSTRHIPIGVYCCALLFLTVFLFFPTKGWADDGSGSSGAHTAQSGANKTYPNFQIDVAPSFMVGNAHEIVWADSTSNTILSQLVWPIPASLGAMLKFNVVWASWLETAIQLQGTPSLTSGDMTDDDYNITDSNGVLDSNVHSDSTAYLWANWRARVEVAVPFHYPNFSWRLMAGMDYQQLYWEAWNAYQTQTPADTNIQPTSFVADGMVGTFRQEWFVPYLGVGGSLTAGQVEFSLAFRLSPYLFENQTDVHAARVPPLTFNDTLTGGYMLEPDLNVAYIFSPSLKLFVDLSYRYIDQPRGTDVATTDGVQTSTVYVAPNVAGASLQSFGASIGLTFSF